MESRVDAFQFCLTSPDAVILTLWPSGGKKCVKMAKEYLQTSGAVILYYTTVKIHKYAALPVIRAIYHGEEWLESNCWYHEQPLATGPPEGPHAGAKWKKELCFKNRDVVTNPYDSLEIEQFILHVFVAEVKSTSSLWGTKYITRAEMARKTGNPGNSCMHITDSQANVSQTRYSSGGYYCDDSFAFHCARVLFDYDSFWFLNYVCENEEKTDKYWDKYTKWLSHSPSKPLLFPEEILERYDEEAEEQARKFDNFDMSLKPKDGAFSK